MIKMRRLLYVSLSRNIEYHLFGTFIQQIMLLVIGYLTFYFEVHDFTVGGKWCTTYCTLCVRMLCSVAYIIR